MRAHVVLLLAALCGVAGASARQQVRDAALAIGSSVYDLGDWLGMW